MKDHEEELIDQINDLKKKLVQDKKNKGKPEKKSSDTEIQSKKKSEASSSSKFQFRKILMTALPFLIIIFFVIGFFAGSSYEQKKFSSNKGSDNANGFEQSDLDDQGKKDNIQEDMTVNNDECFDTDGGIKPFEAGKVFYNLAIFQDACKNSSAVIEYFCNTDNSYGSTIINCDICENNACIQFETRDTGCKESDNYVDYYKKGYVIDKRNRIYVDTCSRNSLTEYYCDNYGFAGTSYKLCNICQDGACIDAQEAKRECIDTDNGVDYYLKGTVTDANGRTATDNCQGRNLEEYYCDPFGYISKTYKLCKQCVEGACIQT